MKSIHERPIIAACGLLFIAGLVTPAHGVQWGDMQADRILFLGNSITTCQQSEDGLMWGLSASEPAKDYVHLLVGKIDAATGGNLTLIPTIEPVTDENGNVDQNGSNVVNICGVFEWGYASYTSERIATQLAMQPNIVVLQFGENIDATTFDPIAFRVGLASLLSDLKENGDPQIFITSYIMGEPAGVGNMKRDACAADPTHRTFVDLTGVFLDANNIGEHYHPSDAGMAVIADTLFTAMEARTAPEPGTIVMLLSAALGVCGCAWMRRKRDGRG